MKEVDIDFYRKELDFYRKEQQELERIENELFYARYNLAKEKDFDGKVSFKARQVAFHRRQHRRADILRPLRDELRANRALYKRGQYNEIDGVWERTGPNESWWEYQSSKLNKEAEMVSLGLLCWRLVEDYRIPAHEKVVDYITRM